MNTAIVRTAIIDGIRARPAEVRVERRSSSGRCQLEVSGTGRAADTAYGVLTAFSNGELEPPSGTFSAVVSPESTNTVLHDIPIALGLLAAAGRIKQEQLASTLAAGGLQPDGTLIGVAGIFPIAGLCAELSLRLTGPARQRIEAAWAGPVQALLRRDLKALARSLEQNDEPETIMPPSDSHDRQHMVTKPIEGYQNVKVALEIAITGGHPLLIASEPGAPITELVRRATQWPGPLPPKEWKTLTTSRSIAGLTEEFFNPDMTGEPYRPFRAPHCSASYLGIAGKAKSAAEYHGVAEAARPGEAALAHGGVVYLDEADDFDRRSLDTLFEACTFGSVTYRTAKLPADIVLIGNAETWRADRLRTRRRDRRGGVFQCGVAAPFEGYGTTKTGATANESNDWQRPEKHWRHVQVRCARAAQYERYGEATTNGRANRETLLSKGNPAPEVLDRIKELEPSLGAARTTNVLRIALTMSDLFGNRYLQAKYLQPALAFEQGNNFGKENQT